MRTERLAYAGLAATCVAAIVATGESGWLALGVALAPDVALLYGAGPGLAKGQLHPRAVGLYNALHSFAGPVVAAAAAVWLGPAWTVVALAWAAHVAVDRAVGYGPRTAEGFQAG
jgi:hypothetical protein